MKSMKKYQNDSNSRENQWKSREKEKYQNDSKSPKIDENHEKYIQKWQ